MTAYEAMSAHLERHIYKRGKFKGDAPADKTRRGNTGFRVIKAVDKDTTTPVMIVRMYRADLITAYEDGRILLDTAGWHDSQTTKLRMNEAFSFFVPFNLRIYNSSILSQRQTVIRSDGKQFKYYDGMVLGAMSELQTKPRPFKMCRIDKAESKELASDLKESGFAGMFPILYATCTVEDKSGLGFGDNTTDIMRDADQAHKWAAVIAYAKYENRYSYHTRSRHDEERGTAKSCWATLMTNAKKNMYATLDSNVFVL
jgi:hypothetical protein